jgi:hypothetical protein
MERHTRITINTSELLLVKKLKGTAEADCLSCGRRVKMATPEQAVTLTGIHSRTIYGWVEGGLVHFIETADGYLLICLDSLHPVQENPHQLPVTKSPGKLLPPSKTEED